LGWGEANIRENVIYEGRGEKNIRENNLIYEDGG
jgi:hypothetical protein